MKRGIICKEDYEVYRFPIPVMMNRKKRRTYISSELEKLHPCFSERCCFETSLHPAKKGLVASVTVMDKIKLARYHARFPGKKLVLAENVHVGVFVDKRKKYIAVVAVLCACAVLCIYVRTMRANKKVDVDKVPEQMIQAAVAVHPSLKPQEIVASFADKINLTQGLVQQVSYMLAPSNDQNASLTIEASLKNCFPEAVTVQKEVVASVGPVSFQNGIPSFTLLLTKSGLLEGSVCHEEIPVTYLRNMLLKDDASILTENDETQELSFCIQCENFITAAQLITTFCKEHDAFIQRVTVANQSQLVACTLSLASGRYLQTETVMIELARCVARHKKSTSPQRNKIIIQQQKQDSQNVIGKIYTKEGVEIVYFRDKNGVVQEQTK